MPRRSRFFLLLLRYQMFCFSRGAAGLLFRRSTHYSHPQHGDRSIAGVMRNIFGALHSHFFPGFQLGHRGKRKDKYYGGGVTLIFSCLGGSIYLHFHGVQPGCQYYLPLALWLRHFCDPLCFLLLFSGFSCSPRSHASPASSIICVFFPRFILCNITHIRWRAGVLRSICWGSSHQRGYDTIHMPILHRVVLIGSSSASASASIHCWWTDERGVCDFRSDEMIEYIMRERAGLRT
ncbi:hypothetical protein F4778DRAFT_139144 [Xylariomycetidae sp. FL2044]|nr:hypothetical protein F4778DRAFT_139144 [Xylariomycetidae sp. FL2044]